MEADEEYIETLRCIVEQEKINQKSVDSVDDDLIEKQVELNTRRHDMNIVDREEIIFKNEEGEFVQ